MAWHVCSTYATHEFDNNFITSLKRLRVIFRYEDVI